MRKLIPVSVALAALLWSAAAWAVVKETQVTITDGGTPVAGATVTLSTPPTQTAQPVRRPTATPTDSRGTTTVTYDDQDARAGVLVDVTVRTADGSARTLRGVPLATLVSGRPLNIAGATPGPGTFARLPAYYWGFDAGVGRIGGIKDPPVGSETLRSRGSGPVFGAHLATCALLVAACIEANIRNGESGKSQEVAGFQLRTKKALLLALAVGVPFALGDTPFYLKPFVGLGYGRFTSEVGGFRASDWMATWQIGLALGLMFQGPFGQTFAEIYWRRDEAFDRQDVTLGRIKHRNDFVGVRFSIPLGER